MSGSSRWCCQAPRPTTRPRTRRPRSLNIANDLDGANLTLSGIGTSASANAGSESFAAPGTLALGGSAAGNYTLAGIAVNGSAVNVGQLAVVLSGAKTYDATANAPAAELGIGNDLDGANLTLSGIGTLCERQRGLGELRRTGHAGADGERGRATTRSPASPATAVKPR